jgi:hypothetical protein
MYKYKMIVVIIIIIAITNMIIHGGYGVVYELII